jgi:hypothetical protein
MVLLSFLRRMARRSEALLPLGAPVVNTSPGETAPLGSLGMGAVPLGTALGLAVPVPGGVWVGVVWAEAALKLHRPAASRRGDSFMGKGKKRLQEHVPQNGAEGCGSARRHPQPLAWLGRRDALAAIEQKLAEAIDVALHVFDALEADGTPAVFVVGGHAAKQVFALFEHAQGYP